MINSDIPWDAPKQYERALALPDLKSPCYDVLKCRGSYEKLAEKFTSERSILVRSLKYTFFGIRSLQITFNDLNSYLIYILHKFYISFI